MLNNFKEQLQTYLAKVFKESYPAKIDLPLPELEIPNDKQHGDLACSIALQSAKILKKPPFEIAEEICSLFQTAVNESPFKDKLEKIEVRRPGFINFFLVPAALHDVLKEILIQGDQYGCCAWGQKKRAQIEFVSANPTGPLSVAMPGRPL